MIHDHFVYLFVSYFVFQCYVSFSLQLVLLSSRSNVSYQMCSQDVSYFMFCLIIMSVIHTLCIMTGLKRF